MPVCEGTTHDSADCTPTLSVLWRSGAVTHRCARRTATLPAAPPEACSSAPSAQRPRSSPSASFPPKMLGTNASAFWRARTKCPNTKCGVSQCALRCMRLDRAGRLLAELQFDCHRQLLATQARHRMAPPAPAESKEVRSSLPVVSPAPAMHLISVVSDPCRRLGTLRAVTCCWSSSARPRRSGRTASCLRAMHQLLVRNRVTAHQ